MHKAFESTLKYVTEDKSECIQHLLHFLGQSIEYHGGKKIHDIQKIINLVIQLMSQDFPLEVVMTVSQIGAVLLLSKNFTIGQLEASLLAKKILNTEHVDVFESFVTNSISCTQFDILIMPDFIKYFEKNFSKSTMEIMAKIIEIRKSNQLLQTSEFEGYSLPVKNQITIDRISKCILNYSSESGDYEEFLLAIQILPHLRTFDNDKIEKHLRKISREILKGLKKDSSMSNVFVFAIIVSTLKSITGSYAASEIVEIINVMLTLEKSFPVLKIINYFIKILKQKHQSSLNASLFDKIRTALVDNLLSQYQQVRHLTSQILSSFDHLKLVPVSSNCSDSIYTIFKEIEEITPTIQTYRNQILLLHKLDFDSAHFKEIKNTQYAEDAIKFCIGFLHINFQLLWEPIRNVLESYASNFDTSIFWTIIHDQLKAVRDIVKEKDYEADFTQNEYVKEKFKEFVALTDRYDAISYRVKLLQVLSDSKTNIHDVKQRDIVELFFNFLKMEYEVDLEETSDGEAPKGRQKLLISHLQVLLKFSNPKCIMRTDELRKLYLDLLLHRNFQVQKLALDCIMHYKEIAVTTYKEILHNCINEKTSRHEIMGLNLDEKIQSDLRAGFMEIFLPILYSKLTIKASKKDQEGFKSKKEVIVRFMNHLKEHELIQLTDIAIGNNISNITSNENCCKDLIESINSVSFKVNELQSKLQFLDLIRKNVAGAYSETYQRKILRSTLAIACCTVNNEATMYKNLKQSCQHSILEFYEQYESFKWSEDEIELIFKIFIWKYLDTFAKDASQNITGLMKIFVEWSKNPKYFNLLERTNVDGNYPIKSIIGLLLNKSTSGAVIECVMEILERLLILVAEDEVVKTYNYGTQLIEPFIMEILTKLKDILIIKKSRMLSSRNLLILSRVTELVKDEESSKLLLDILFPLTLKKAIEEQHDAEGITKLLTTISNLLKVVTQPESYLRSFAPLFEYVREVNHRKFLVKTFKLVAHSDENLQIIVTDLNAYDKRWIEQPDFEKRLSAFHRVEKGEISIELAVIMIYHCFYFLKYEKDLAIRDNSSHHLKVICSRVITKYKDDKKQIDFFLDKIVLNLLQKRMREKSELRTETINLLGELARNHPESHPVLSDLHSLTDSKNRELDFFDNITHLQKFRHMKALRKFVETAKTYKAIPNLRTLNDFLLPISKIFLCTEDYQRKSKVIEAAIEYVACICKFLPWNQYEMVLKFYIRKMKFDSKAYQKQLVKLIPAILDAFHYSLSMNENVAVEIEKVNQEIAEENDNDESDNEEDEEVQINDEDEQDASKAIEEITILRPNVSQRVIRSLTKRFIPSLFRIISELATNTAHKANKEERRLKEKNDMIKIPIALPLIKLLQKLPPRFLKQYMSQVVLKVSTFLKSTLKQVRATARHTLKEILIALGAEHLQVVIENLSGILCKGFQMHVLSVTVHTLIDSLKSQLVASNITDKILQKVLDICMNDIFGKNQEEQLVDKIGHRTPEAKASRKSFLTLNILASTLSEKCVLDLILPFKNQLLETQSKRTVMKLQDCLAQIASGLTVNTKIPIDALMILIHGTISESIPNLLPERKKKHDNNQQKKIDCFIIAEEPRRRGATAQNKNVKSSKQTNSYVLVEFGLELMHILMKKKKLDGAQGFLDPLISLLLDSMRGNFLRVSLLAVRCFSLMWHHKMEIDNLKVHTPNIATEIFAILHKYAASEISRKDNHYLLVKSAFKAVVVLIRHIDYYTVSETQLKALLLYIEQDLVIANDKDTISFVLLKAILDRKLIVPEIHEVLKKIAEMSITCEVIERRNVIRPIVLTYLMEYPLGKKIDQLLKFFVAQLNYEEISGRESAIDMMCLIIKHFPQVNLP